MLIGVGTGRLPMQVMSVPPTALLKCGASLRCNPEPHRVTRCHCARQMPHDRWFPWLNQHRLQPAGDTSGRVHHADVEG